MELLLTAPISKAAARQRSGRAGRTRPGICFALYPREVYERYFVPSSLPGILSGEISGEILLLKAMGYNAVGRFDFVDPPHPEVYLRGLQELHAL